MKFKITFKDPDGVYDAVQEAVKESVDSIEGLDSYEREELMESRQEVIEESLKQFLRYSEYVTIEFDTDAGTATVCKVH